MIQTYETWDGQCNPHHKRHDVINNIMSFSTMCTFENRPGCKRDLTRDQFLDSAQFLLMEADTAALGLRQITTHAGMIHARCHNDYLDVTALLGDLGE